MAFASGDPNFPSGLDIRPLSGTASDQDARFDSCAQEGAIRTYGIAGRIWEASHAMLVYLDPAFRDSIDFDPLPFTRLSSRQITVVELGSGNGFLATHVAQWLRPDEDLLIATDLPSVCPLLETNLQSCPAARVCPLPWGFKGHVDEIFKALAGEARFPTHILCSDLVYFPALLAPLLRSLLHLTSKPLLHHRNTWISPPVIISYKIRSLAKETSFWNAFGLWFNFSAVLSRHMQGSTSPITSEHKNEDFQWSRFSHNEASNDTFVLVATRRPASHSWKIPDDEAALLSGVGAYDSNNTKSDDQFEQLLLMEMEI